MNKITLLLIASLTCTIASWSQKKLTVSAFMGIGRSSFRGTGAENSSVYYRSSLVPPTPPNFELGTMRDQYGKEALTNFMAGLRADIQFPSKWLIQLTSQYEYTGAKMTIDSVITPTSSINTEGVYTRYYDLVSINPAVGRVLFQNASFKLLLHGGLDFVVNIAMGQRHEYKNEQDGKNYSIGGSGGNPEINDFRVTGGLSLLLNKIGLDLNYKYGVANFNEQGTGNVYSKLVHVRLMYRFISRSI